MAYDGNGNHSLPAGSIVATGDKVLPSQHNPPLQDISASLSMVMVRDGRAPMLGNLPMNGNRVTGMAPGESATDGATVGQSTPIGGIIDFAGTTAPDGWLLCAGQAVSRSTYAALFSVLGTAFGNGNGSTTFNVPDLRGRVVAGLDNMGGTDANRLTTMSSTTRGEVGGAAAQTLTIAQMPAHTHAVSGSTNNAGVHEHGVRVSDGGGFSGQTAAAGSLVSTATYNATPPAGNHSHTVTGTAASQGGGGAHPNVQPTLVMSKIIRATY